MSHQLPMNVFTSRFYISAKSPYAAKQIEVDSVGPDIAKSPLCAESVYVGLKSCADVVSSWSPRSPESESYLLSVAR